VWPQGSGILKFRAFSEELQTKADELHLPENQDQIALDYMITSGKDKP